MHVRPGGETVAFRSEGNRLSDRWAGAAAAAGLHFWGPDLTDPDFEVQAISLTTTRENYEGAAALAEKKRR